MLDTTPCSEVFYEPSIYLALLIFSFPLYDIKCQCQLLYYSISLGFDKVSFGALRISITVMRSSNFRTANSTIFLIFLPYHDYRVSGRITLYSTAGN